MSSSEKDLSNFSDSDNACLSEQKTFAALETTVGKKTVKKTSLSLAHYVVESAMSTVLHAIRILAQSTVIVV
jgi:hypothetical protein